MVSVFVTGTILLSTAAVIIETLPRFYGQKNQIWYQRLHPLPLIPI